MKRKPLVILLDLFVGSVLIFSSLIHIGNPYFFLEAVLNYRILNIEFATVVAVLLIQACFILGFCLLFSKFSTNARILASGLFLVFVVAQLQAIFTGLEIGCGCFGSETEPIGLWSIFRSLGLFGLTVVAIYLQIRIAKSCVAIDEVKQVQGVSIES